jgi:hypothetical protein
MRSMRGYLVFPFHNRVRMSWHSNACPETNCLGSVRWLHREETIRTKLKVPRIDGRVEPPEHSPMRPEHYSCVRKLCLHPLMSEASGEWAMNNIGGEHGARAFACSWTLAFRDPVRW